MNKLTLNSLVVAATSLLIAAAVTANTKSRVEAPSLPKAAQIDYAKIQFFGVARERITIEGTGTDLNEARLDALRKLGALQDGKFAKVAIVFAQLASSGSARWHYWWHNAGAPPHWKACGEKSPELPVAPGGLKLIVTEKPGSCRMEIRTDPTRADLVWDLGGARDDPSKMFPEGLPKIER